MATVVETAEAQLISERESDEGSALRASVATHSLRLDELPERQKNENAAATTTAATSSALSEKLPERQKDENVAATTTAATSSALSEKSKESSADEREEFSGFRIANRCVTAANMANQLQGSRVIRISRLAELGRRADYNRIVIGVLCEYIMNRFANGELHMQLVLTDLADPQPRRIYVHLRRNAFEHWRKESAKKSLTRASIVALMNPVFSDPGNSQETLPVLRVENPSALVKIGDCPSLGLCSMKGCKLPCNIDLKERFCKGHLAKSYASKGGRSITGGLSTAMLDLASSVPKRKQRTQREVEEDEEVDPNLIENMRLEGIAKRSKVARALPLCLEERRTGNSDAREDYFRSIRQGRRSDENDTSSVPKIGRSLDANKDMEIDVATQKTAEKCKTERLLNLMVEKRAERYVARSSDTEKRVEAPIRSMASKSSKSGTAAPEKKRSLGAMLEALKGRKEPRRLDAEAKGTTQEPSSPSSSPKVDTGLLVDDEKAAIELLKDLTTAGDDGARVKRVLNAADRLPISVLEGEQGVRFFNAVGQLAMHPNNPEIRRAAITARRRWRAASEEAHVEAQRRAHMKQVELKADPQEGLVPDSAERQPCQTEIVDESSATLEVSEHLELNADPQEGLPPDSAERQPCQTEIGDARSSTLEVSEMTVPVSTPESRDLPTPPSKVLENAENRDIEVQPAEQGGA